MIHYHSKICVSKIWRKKKNIMTIFWQKISILYRLNAVLFFSIHQKILKKINKSWFPQKIIFITIFFFYTKCYYSKLSNNSVCEVCVDAVKNWLRLTRYHPCEGGCGVTTLPSWRNMGRITRERGAGQVTTCKDRKRAFLAWLASTP